MAKAWRGVGTGLAPMVMHNASRLWGVYKPRAGAAAALSECTFYGSGIPACTQPHVQNTMPLTPVLHSSSSRGPCLAHASPRVCTSVRYKGLPSLMTVGTGWPRRAECRWCSSYRERASRRASPAPPWARCRGRGRIYRRRRGRRMLQRRRSRRGRWRRPPGRRSRRLQEAIEGRGGPATTQRPATGPPPLPRNSPPNLQQSSSIVISVTSS